MNPRSNILLVEDDEDMRNALVSHLALQEEFETVEASSGTAALDTVCQGHFDLVLLDLGLPDMDGREVCRLIRRKGIHVPIIILTGMDSDADLILGLDAGANDYVAKPFKMGVLLARIRAQLRQHEASEDASFVLGRFSFKPATRVLIENETGSRITLSEKETAILKFLYRAGGTAVECDTLYSEVWSHTVPLSTHTLQTHIYRLRQKIERDPANPEILISQGGGYRVVR